MLVIVLGYILLFMSFEFLRPVSESLLYIMIQFVCLFVFNYIKFWVGGGGQSSLFSPSIMWFPGVEVSTR